MDSKQRQVLKKYLDLFSRKKTLILVVLMVSLPTGLGVYLSMPKEYQVFSLLSYEQQKISPNKLSPEVSSKIRDIVSTLTQLITSRTNLERLILELKLYPNERNRLPMEDVVDSMRQKIKIEPSQQGDIFKIIFNHSNPEQVVKVTNALAARFIEENLKYREERATETHSYTNDELGMAKENMDRKENAMRDYKLKHYNEMPEQQLTNVSRLIALQAQYQSKQESIQDLERTCVLIQDQINNRKLILERSSPDIGIGPAASFKGEQPVSREVQLAKMNLLLEHLLSRYTEEHPDVKRTRTFIDKLERGLRSTDQLVNQTPHEIEMGTGERSANSNPTNTVKADSVTLQLETQYKNVVLNIKNLNSEKELIKTAIAEYEQWVSVAPDREAEWSALTREYGQLKKHYDYLYSQNLEAKSMLNLEKRQKGSQFKIVDPARYPENPIKPNFVKIMGMAVVIGLGFGVGLILVLDFFDGTLRDPETVGEVLGVPLIATIQKIETITEQKRQKWRRYFLTIFLVVGSLSVIGLFVVVWNKGYIVI